MRRIFMATAAVLVLAGGVASGGVAQPPASTSESATPLVDLNMATAEQLETLPGIGVRTAERIIEYRQENGGFKKIEELMNVRGIGEQSFLKLRPLVTVVAEPAGGGGRS